MRSGMSVSTKRRIADRRVRVREVTSFARPMPAFMIIGTQRGGTSSLYKYLEGHPDLRASIRKETEYFSRRFGEGEGWYRAHFPLTLGPGGHRLGFEATPDYLFYPWAPERIAERLPDARFVVLLRDPVRRAYSHYRHMVRLGLDALPFDAALASEEERIASDVTSLERDPLFFCRSLLRFSYATRGRYADQMARWFAAFDPSRFLILRSEDLFADPGRAVDEVTAFLGVRSWRPSAFRNFSREPAGPGADGPSSGAVASLRRTLEPQVVELERMLGRSMDWSLGGSTT
jgi:hypothetical protein